MTGKKDPKPKLPARKPAWLKAVPMKGETAIATEKLANELKLHTVCQEAGCPNRGECFGHSSAAFLIMGTICSRNCTFCQVEKGRPTPLDPDEPEHLARAVKTLGLKHVVVTSVTRDDLPDGGAAHFAAVIKAIRDLAGDNKPVVEVLIPDFQGDEAALKTVVDQKPDILNHNIETVPRLYPTVRPMAIYNRSLELLKRAHLMDPDITIKSGLMVGLGETETEVRGVLEDLHRHHCTMLTIGQYLAPSNRHIPVEEYIEPRTFERYRALAESIGFRAVASAPLVRSSYGAEMLYQQRGT